MKNSEQGLTLIEVMLSAVLIGVVGLALVSVTGSAHTFMMQTTGMATAQGEASFAQLHMKRNFAMANRFILWNAQEVSFRYDHRSITGGTATPMDPTDDGWDYYGLRTSDNALVYKRDCGATADGNAGAGNDPGSSPGTGGTVEVVARNLTSFSMTQVSPAQLRVDLTATRTVGTQTRSSRVVSTISPRGMVTN
ncbi:MAG: prepilin-type N-terminal cleavage/methylation domain-containing protein [Candidatus Omnitrophica bacterium]|nr:prepilin-type N-terminal cleavage/methylation domain-containing protein [Candidatus Omnitrophota bacterium]